MICGIVRNLREGRESFTYLLNVSLGLRVERPSKVGLVSLEVSWATNWVSIIVGVDAASGEDSDVDAFQEASVGQVQGTNNIVSDGLLLMVLAPIHVGSTGGSSSVKNVCWLNFLKLS
jgi:hypothetical protein